MNNHFMAVVAAKMAANLKHTTDIGARPNRKRTSKGEMKRAMRKALRDMKQSEREFNND